MVTDRKKSTGKYGAKPLYWQPGTWDTYAHKVLPNCIYFGSTFEFNVFKELVFWGIPTEYFRHQVEFSIKPATQRYEELFWRCDLVLEPPRDSALPYLLIETKGEVTTDFRLKLQFLELNNPEAYNRLVVVTSDKPKTIDRTLKSVTIPMLKALIKKMSEEF